MRGISPQIRPYRHCERLCQSQVRARPCGVNRRLAPVPYNALGTGPSAEIKHYSGAGSLSIPTTTARLPKLIGSRATRQTRRSGCDRGPTDARLGSRGLTKYRSATAPCSRRLSTTISIQSSRTERRDRAVRAARHLSAPHRPAGVSWRKDSPSSSPSASVSASPSVSTSSSASSTPEPPRLIRRMRQSPHLSDEQVNLFFGQFQLDLEAGLGLMDGQGVDPMLMLQWSDDGGKTWSSEHWMSAGRQGRYAFRAIWRRLGRARTRTWRVTFSDPTPTRWIDAFVQASKGTS